MPATIRKNITLDAQSLQKLERLAKIRHTTHSGLIKELLDEAETKRVKQEKLAALERLAGCATGMFGDKNYKELRAEALKEKYGL